MPHQGYRSDFWYPNAKHFPSQIFMICPEFEDEEGQLILDKSVPVPRSGTARMWILIPKMRLYHQDKIQVRSKGYLMEGPNRVAECMVIQIMGLNTNPTQ